jgi:CheY-like chemotaxis protein
MKILVVEDVPSELKLARVVLTSAGHEVSEADTAQKALTVIREHPPELILLDLKLPDIDGLELIRQLKQNRTTQDMPIVAVTSYPDNWTQREALEAGCTVYVIKPIDARDLLQQITNIVVQRRNLKAPQKRC